MIRSHRVGDVSWAVHRQAVLYRDAYGWNGHFETMVAGIGAEFLKSHDPARGLGLGRRLVEECMNFAMAVGYRRMTLWTNDCLIEARNLYASFGFELISEHPHSDYGRPMVGQEYERHL